MLLSPSLPILNKPVSVSLVKSRVGTGLTKSGLGFSKIFPRPKPRPETVKNGPETSLAETGGVVSVSLKVSDRLGSAREVPV